MIIADILTHKIFLVGVIAILITKPFKAIYYSIKKDLSFIKAFWYMGGMPSTHSCLVGALITAIYLHEGASAAFFVALGLGILVLYDALTLRNYVEKHSIAINKLIKKRKHNESVGHNFWEVTAGFILGVVVAVLVWVI